MKIRTIIIDDEPLARQRIEGLLSKVDEVDVICQCKNGMEAIDAITQHQPDLIFLDIQMPGVDGFGVLDKIGTLPVVTFVTAYDHYAMQAFDYHAIDYLLKPYKDERFYESLSLAIKQIQLQNLSGIHQKLESLRESTRQKESYFKGINFEIKHLGRLIKVNSNDIIYVNSAGNYVELHSKEATHLVRSTISSLEYDLEQNGFLRIHRSILINESSIARVHYLNSNNQYKFVLSNGTELQSSRSFKDRIVSYLERAEQ
ncbi:MAG: LytTR family DNA-binding domain-containing protein [Colwellia sp.]|nr:LytTR family DNA-binding domain-containing protein [Colwellia sp.]